MSGFDTIVVVDWSGGNDRGPTPKTDAIWTCVARTGHLEQPVYHRNRTLFEPWLEALLDAELAAGRRVLVGFDFPFGYPAGFAEALTGAAEPFAVWRWLEARIEDAPARNNRWAVAGGINARFSGIGPFWGNGARDDVEHLPRKGRARCDHGMSELRAAERATTGAFSCWQLAGAGAVGSQMLMGLPVLERLRARYSDRLAVWPFEQTDSDIALVEVWPSLIGDVVARTMPVGEIKDAHQVRTLAAAIAALTPEALGRILDVDERLAQEEGWIFGLGHEDMLREAAIGALREHAA